MKPQDSLSRPGSGHATGWWTPAVVRFALARALALAALLGGADFAAAADAVPSAVCIECHRDAALSMQKDGAKISLHVAADQLVNSAHAVFDCVDCHAGFDPDAVPHREKIAPVNCVTCHEGLAKSHAFHPDFAAKPFADTVQTGCTDCHGKHAIVGVKDANSPVRGAKLAATCATCHDDAAKQFGASAHGAAFAAGRAEAPDCLSCHRTSVTRGGDASREVKLAQSQLCLSCHLDNPRVLAGSVMGATFVSSYGHSVHGQALTRGDAKAANCVDCHGSHGVNKAVVAGSAVNKQHIPETCAKCHAGEAKQYAAGVHAVALHKGNRDAPACTDCHGEHDILVHTDPNAPVAAANVSQMVCGSCHASVKLNRRYGLATDRFRTFQDSFHGLATRGGAVEAVNCASCHGAHEIRHSSDPLSPVNKARLAQTCGQCHPGANARFAVGAVHVNEASAAESPVVYWVATLYVWLIVVVVGGMFFHNVADFAKKVRRKIAVQKGALVLPELPHRLYLRMTVNERLQHGTLVLSFVALVVTGFMLRYPEAWWVATIRGWSGHLFEWRGLLHRIAAVAMVASGLWHFAYLACTVRGRRLFRDLLPRWQDARDALGVLRYNLGLAAAKPRFGRFSYIEKSEYWALLWGSVIMGATGAFLWFENTSIGLFTKLGYDVSRTVHFYEAVLATLAIVVWHFYFVIFNPDVYPMNLSWLTGRVSEEEMHEDHPLELEQIKAERADEAAAALPPVPPVPPAPPLPPEEKKPE